MGEKEREFLNAISEEEHRRWREHTDKSLKLTAKKRREARKIYNQINREDELKRGDIDAWEKATELVYLTLRKPN